MNSNLLKLLSQFQWVTHWNKTGYESRCRCCDRVSGDSEPCAFTHLLNRLQSEDAAVIKLSEKEFFAKNPTLSELACVGELVDGSRWIWNNSEKVWQRTRDPGVNTYDHDKFIGGGVFYTTFERLNIVHAPPFAFHVKTSNGGVIVFIRSSHCGNHWEYYAATGEAAILFTDDKELSSYLGQLIASIDCG